MDYRVMSSAIGWLRCVTVDLETDFVPTDRQNAYRIPTDAQFLPTWSVEDKFVGTITY